MNQQGLSIFDKIIGIAFKNKNILLALIIAIALGSGGYYAWSLSVAKKEEKAMEQYALGEKLYQAGSSLAQSLVNDPKQTPPKVDNSQAANHFNQVLKDFPGTKASYLAAIRLSDVYASQNDFIKTTEVLEPIVQSANGKNLIVGMIALKLSGLYEKQQQCEKAVPVLQKLVDHQNQLKPEAYLRLGLCFENLNQKDKAVEVYQKLTQEFSDSTQGQQAQKYLKLLKS